MNRMRGKKTKITDLRREALQWEAKYAGLTERVLKKADRRIADLVEEAQGGRARLENHQAEVRTQISNLEEDTRRRLADLAQPHEAASRVNRLLSEAETWRGKVSD